MELTATSARRQTSSEELGGIARDEARDAEANWAARDQAERAAEHNALTWLVFFGWMAMTALVFLAVVFF